MGAHPATFFRKSYFDKVAAMNTTVAGMAGSVPSRCSPTA